MNCQETQKLVHGYLDGELDLVKNLEVEQHLQECSACAGQHVQLQALRTTLQEGLYYQPPVGLRDRVRKALDSASPAVSAKRRLSRRWLAVAAALAMVAVAGWSLARLLPTTPADAPLVAELVASHVRSQMLPEHLVDVKSSDRHEVKPWFKGKVDFSPLVYDLKGFPLIGGRLDYLDRRPVTALVYSRRKHFINLYLWPSVPGREEPDKTLNRQGYNLLHWDQSGMSCWAVSDLNETELREFARLFQEQGR